MSDAAAVEYLAGCLEAGDLPVHGIAPRVEKALIALRIAEPGRGARRENPMELFEGGPGVRHITPGVSV